MAATRSTPRRWVLSLLTVALVASAASRPYASDTNPNLELLKGIEQKTLTLAPPLVEATVGLSIPGGGGMGSGVIVSENGLIMTAGHVVPASGKDMIVHFNNGKSAKAKALGADRYIDAGLAQITTEGKWPHVKIGKSSELKKGDWVMAIGNPGGFRTDRRPPIRLGRILSLPDTNKNSLWIQTDATVAPGDSGGPLFNLNGEVIGIHSNISPKIEENRHVAADDYLSRWQSLKSGKQTGNMFGLGHQRRPELGVQPEDSEGQIVIGEIVKDSPAAEAGLKVGDVILSLDGVEPKNAQDFRDNIRRKQSGREVTLVIERDGEKKTIKPKLKQGPYVFENPPDDFEEFLKKHGYELSEGKYEYQRTPETEDEFNKLMRKYADQRFRLALAGSKVDTSLTKAAPKLLEGVSLLGKSVNKSVAQIYNSEDNKSVVYGTVISKDGYILTKASELKGEFYCRIGSKEYDGKVIAKRPDFDLALIKVDATDLSPVNWSSQSDPSPGMLLITPDADGNALALGIVSNAAREIGNSLTPNKAVMGVTFGGVDGTEVLIGEVTKGGPAEKAGLKKGDLIIAIDGKKVAVRTDVLDMLKPKKPGDKIKVEVRRGEEDKSFDVTLAHPRIFEGTRGPGRGSGRGAAVEFEKAAHVSSRKENFPMALTHDSALTSDKCGGPIVNLMGQVVGLNIARFDRTGTYALTYQTLKPVLDEMIKEAKPTKDDDNNP